MCIVRGSLIDSSFVISERGIDSTYTICLGGFILLGMVGTGHLFFNDF